MCQVIRDSPIKGNLLTANNTYLTANIALHIIHPLATVLSTSGALEGFCAKQQRVGNMRIGAIDSKSQKLRQAVVRHQQSTLSSGPTLRRGALFRSYGAMARHGRSIDQRFKPSSICF